jgi:BirA family biotin operon repressor/biotin-[acetyl-CoA-carboxylase] ligase|tara:strand:+ start:92 stop:682 length:591 start_codon:yes stop_codon:yes gene_type:complete
MKFKIFKFKKVKSTNETAINLIKKKNQTSGIIYSSVQTNGRGTHGKKWISQKGNLFASIFFPLEENYPSSNEFTTINSILVSDVIKTFCKKENVKLKYPNDIFLNKKKVCGILQETIELKDKKFLIVGIGVNIKFSPHNRTNYQTTNIFYETKEKPSIIKITNLLVKKYEDFFKKVNSYKFNNFKIKADTMIFNGV